MSSWGLSTETRQTGPGRNSLSHLRRAGKSVEWEVDHRGTPGASGPVGSLGSPACVQCPAGHGARRIAKGKGSCAPYGDYESVAIARECTDGVGNGQARGKRDRCCRG
jgi:hypothetical protein